MKTRCAVILLMSCMTITVGLCSLPACNGEYGYGPIICYYPEDAGPDACPRHGHGSEDEPENGEQPDGGLSQNCEPSGECVPLAPAGWDGPMLLWKGKKDTVPECPPDAPALTYHGFRDLDAPNTCS